MKTIYISVCNSINITNMKKSTTNLGKLVTALLMVTVLALTSCKGNPSTTSGDSTGTGAAGAKVPGFSSTKDTTSHDTTGGGTGDSAKSHIDTTKKK
jgi:hypothetical protein